MGKLKVAKAPMTLKVGQVWRENDLRFHREIEIVGLGKDWAGVKNVQTGRFTRVKDLSRFDGRRGGYVFVSDAKEKP